MGWFSNLFDRRNSGVQTTTINRPFRISNPTIGFLNLQGPAGEALSKLDQSIISPLFAESHASTNVVPKCAVLFLYCTIDAPGTVVGAPGGVRQMIKDAGAYIAVVASENPADAYIKAIGPRNDWHANIALVVDRKGEKLPRFFRTLFNSMFDGKSMLTAWVELAPQIPRQDHSEAPGAIMAAEAGHIIFAR